jgi:NAD(P)-dependent dehydrogenase (short-subunit alcohol dehydrogenase family)
MRTDGSVALVTGGASGLARATAERLHEHGAQVVILDLPTAAGDDVAASLGDRAHSVHADVTDPEQVQAAVDDATGLGPLRILVHCAGRGTPLRIVEKGNVPGDLERFEFIVRLNIVGTFNMLRLVATSMTANEPLDGDRGVCVLTASIAAFDGQIGQIPYAASKAGIVGMTLVAARDLASKKIRVCTIAPGTFDTPLLGRLAQPVLDSLAAAVPHPARLGNPTEFAALAHHIVENQMLNGETIRLDGAMRMPPR